jgi:hypothetical protein
VLPELADDPLAAAEQLALRIIGAGWTRFVDQSLDALPQLPVLTLTALAAELFARYANDEARVVRAMAHEAQRLPTYRRTPRQLLADMEARGFRAPPDAPTATPVSVLLN